MDWEIPYFYGLMEMLLDHDRALSYFNAALNSARTCKNAGARATLQTLMGQIYFEQEQWALARRCFRNSKLCAWANEVDNAYTIGVNLFGLATINLIEAEAIAGNREFHDRENKLTTAELTTQAATYLPEAYKYLSSIFYADHPYLVLMRQHTLHERDILSPREIQTIPNEAELFAEWSTLASELSYDLSKISQTSAYDLLKRLLKLSAQLFHPLDKNTGIVLKITSGVLEKGYLLREAQDFLRAAENLYVQVAGAESSERIEAKLDRANYFYRRGAYSPAEQMFESAFAILESKNGSTAEYEHIQPRSECKLLAEASEKILTLSLSAGKALENNDPDKALGYIEEALDCQNAIVHEDRPIWKPLINVFAEYQKLTGNKFKLKELKKQIEKLEPRREIEEAKLQAVQRDSHPLIDQENLTKLTQGRRRRAS